ncbi:hypothetical protein [Streptomyces vilmorinianum]|uniref:hypothetical protein n=1 Tax=Streptomyces vilmorinianum TaxID=3051092 RepID=UPI0010FB04A8|nr:hypothetical protein [Streptomyces vilmorinianum]
MLVRPAAPAFAAVAVCASLLVTGCSAGGSDGATGERAYYGCLEENGVVLEKRDDGVLRVDKDKGKNDGAAYAAAQAKCADLLTSASPTASASPPSAAFMDHAKKFSACVRANGYPRYPDPDPATGEVKVPAEEEATYKTPEFAAVVTKCSTDPGDGIVGG